MTAINPTIFRAYDIRGKAHEQLSAQACELIGRAFGSELKERTGKEHPAVCVGRDARTHSPEFEAAVVRGLAATGCRILRIGQTPSPVNYFTVCRLGLDGGVQVTASHNPAHDNGLKLSLADAEAFAGEDLQRLRRRIEEEGFGPGQGSEEEIDGVTPYLEAMARIFGRVAEGMAIAVDAGNGVAGPAYCEALRRAGATLTELYTEPDGTFPNHAADPSKHDTLRDLQKAVREGKCAAGLAYDGDGDRVGLVDETGAIRTADEILLLRAKAPPPRPPGKPVVFTVSNSGTLKTEIAAWGGAPAMCKVGHSFVEHAMREHGALLGGEQSGHFFCAEDYHAFDDALVASLRLLQILKGSGKTVSQLMADFPRVYQAPEKRPHCPDDRKGDVVAAAVEHFAKDREVETMDGARIEFGEGAWAGIRQSNTSPCLSICIEARSPEKLREVEEEILGFFRGFPEVAWEAGH